MQQSSGGVRALKSKNEAELSDSSRPNPLEGRSSGKLFEGGPRGKPEEQTTKTIAEAAAAKEEEDRKYLSPAHGQLTRC
jgi:hypothetical protein